MSSIVIAGDTSGSVTLQAPAVSGSTILTLPATSGTVQTSGAGYTTNGVAFASSTSVLATGSALTFDGTNFGVGGAASQKFHVQNAGAVIGLLQNTASSADARYRIQNTAGSSDWGVDATGTYFQDNNSRPFLWFTGGSEQMRLNSTGLGIGTSSPSARFDVRRGDADGLIAEFHQSGGYGIDVGSSQSVAYLSSGYLQAFTFKTDSGSGQVERARIDSSGNLLVGKTTTSDAAGCILYGIGLGYFVRSGGNVLEVNRLTNDGTLIAFSQDSTNEGSISVSGTTVSYNGGHLSRWAQTTAPKDNTLVKGTVLSNLDAMNVYTDAKGNPVDNEQLNKVKVSDTEGDVNVAGVFVNWTHDDAHNVDEINMAMTGDMIIRIAQGVTVVRGDLLMSAGDGTAKPQGDDIVRSKTVAKVTSNHVTCTYADGSYCVPCVLMAC